MGGARVVGGANPPWRLVEAVRDTHPPFTTSKQAESGSGGESAEPTAQEHPESGQGNGGKGMQTRGAIRLQAMAHSSVPIALHCGCRRPHEPARTTGVRTGTFPPPAGTPHASSFAGGPGFPALDPHRGCLKQPACHLPDVDGDGGGPAVCVGLTVGSAAASQPLQKATAHRSHGTAVCASALRGLDDGGSGLACPFRARRR